MSILSSFIIKSTILLFLYTIVETVHKNHWKNNTLGQVSTLGIVGCPNQSVLISANYAKRGARCGTVLRGKTTVFQLANSRSFSSIAAFNHSHC